MRPGRGAMGAINASAVFVFGLAIEGLAYWLHTIEANALIVWACIVIGLVIAIPLAYFELFDRGD